MLCESSSNQNHIPSKASNKGDSRKRFVPPSQEDVEQYCAKMGYGFDVASFMAFYQSNGWKVGRNPMKCWKSACTTWEKREKEKRQQKGRGPSGGKFTEAEIQAAAKPGETWDQVIRRLQQELQKRGQ